MGLISYTGQTIRVLGWTKLDVMCGFTRVFKFDIFVVKDGDNIKTVGLLNRLAFNGRCKQTSTTDKAGEKPVNTINAVQLN